MKYQLMQVIAILLLTVCSASAQTSSGKTENTSTLAEAQRYFETEMINVFDRMARVERAKAIMLDNEIEPGGEGLNTNFYGNPLLLNGSPLDYADFSINSRGILTLVEGNPESPDAKKVPFRIYLRREGVVILQGKSDTRREVTEIELAEVLAEAKPNDHLIIVPVRKSDRKAKRILLVFDGC